jgi:nucleoside-triphosphatase
MDLSSELWLVTGWRGAGKTTFCGRLAHIARAQGLQVAGLLSRAVFTDGIKTAIQAEDLCSQASHPLASIFRQNESDLFFGEWYFDREVFDWGNQVLRASPPCDLLVVDEVGPLEFKLHTGWQAAFDVLAVQKNGYRLGLVVVRPELQAEARSAFPITHTIELGTAEDIERLVPLWAERMACMNPARNE